MVAQWSKENIKAVFEKIKSYSTFPNLQLYVEGGTTNRLVIAKNEVVESTELTSVQLHLVVTNDQQWLGESWSDSLEESALLQLVKSAESAATTSQHKGRIDPIKPSQPIAEPALWNDKTAALTWANRVALFTDSIKYCQAHRYHLNSYWEDKKWYQSVLNTKGIYYYQASTPCKLDVRVTTTVNPGIGYQSQVIYDYTKIRPTLLTEQAAHKAQIGTNGRTPQMGEVEVLLEARAVRELLTKFLLGYQRPLNIENSFQRSVQNTAALSSLLQVTSDPMDKSFGFTSFTPQGDKIMPTTWIENGRIVELPSVKTPIKMQAGGATIEQLQQRVQRGIVVANVQGLAYENRSGSVLTGVTTGGTFWVENGKVTTPIKNVRFQVDCFSLFDSIVALGIEERIDEEAVAAILSSHFVITSVSDSY